MPPNSNTSSLDPQNGSAYRYFLSLRLRTHRADTSPSHSNPDLPFEESNTGSTYPTDHTTQAQYPIDVPYNQTSAAATQPTRDTGAGSNDQHYASDYTINYTDGNSYTKGDHSQSASNHETICSSDEQQQLWWDDEGCQRYRQYYLPVTPYAQETPNYDPELVIDSIEDDQCTSRFSNQPEYREARARLHQPSTTGSTQENPQPANVARTPTARRWSREYSPEERMRVGLLRWETEQHRINYERQQRPGHRRS
jgi:hypothetical protein